MSLGKLKSVAALMIVALALGACGKSSSSNDGGGSGQAGNGDGTEESGNPNPAGGEPAPLSGKSNGLDFAIGSARLDHLAGGYANITTFTAAHADPCAQMSASPITLGAVYMQQGTPAINPVVVYSGGGARPSVAKIDRRKSAC